MAVDLHGAGFFTVRALAWAGFGIHGDEGNADKHSNNRDDNL